MITTDPRESGATRGFPPMKPISLAPSKEAPKLDYKEMANILPCAFKPYTNRSEQGLARKYLRPVLPVNPNFGVPII